MKKYTKKIRNFVRKKDEHAGEVLKSFSAIVEQDEMLREQTDTVNCRYKSFILKQVPGFRRSIKRELDNFLLHIQKGCQKDPFEMNHRINPDDPFSDLNCGRGS